MHEDVYFISALTNEGVDDVLEALYKLVASETKEVKKPTEEERKITLTSTDEIIIEKADEHTFRVSNKTLERRVELADFDKQGSINELLRYFDRIELEKKLKKKGIKEGDRVIIGSKSFIYQEE